MNLLRQPWKLCVVLVLFMVIAEGAIRKWLLPGLSEFVYFAKDVLMVMAYMLYLSAPKDFSLLPSRDVFQQFVLVAAAVIGINIFNPALGSSIVGIFGWKAYMLYVPLIFLVPHLFDSLEDFQGFMRMYAMWLIPVCLLGILQFDSSSESVLNKYASGTEEVAVFGEDANLARITGTFSYISGFTAYLQVMGAILLVVIANARSLVWFWCGIAQMVLLAGNVLMTGSRAPVLLLCLTVLGFVPSAFQMAPEASRLRTALAFTITGIAVSVSLWFSDAYRALENRTLGGDEQFMERAFQHHDVFLELPGYAGFFGFGPGSTHPGSSGIRSALALDPPTFAPADFEAEHARVMIEIGWPGWLVWYSLRIGVVMALFKTWRRLNDFRLRLWALAALLIHLLNLNGAVVLNHTFGVYAWFTAGFIFLLPKLEAVECLRAKASILAKSPTKQFAKRESSR